MVPYRMAYNGVRPKVQNGYRATERRSSMQLCARASPANANTTPAGVALRKLYQPALGATLTFAPEYTLNLGIASSA